MYSQNNEDEIISQYFGSHIGTLLDIGANDGVTFSNSKLLIDKGWVADLVEPSDYGFNKLSELYSDNRNVRLHKCAMSSECFVGTLHESGAHVKNGTDRALVSTIQQHEKNRWGNVAFKEIEVSVIDFNTFHQHLDLPKFDFISIDAEGEDWNILSQIDLNKVGCKCLCIEYNSIQSLAQLYSNYCAKFGLKEIHRNAENIIFAA